MAAITPCSRSIPKAPRKGQLAAPLGYYVPLKKALTPYTPAHSVKFTCHQ